MAQGRGSLERHLVRIMAWHLCHTGPCFQFCGNWSFDLSIFLHVSCILSEQPSVDWEVHQGRRSLMLGDV